MRAARSALALAALVAAAAATTLTDEQYYSMPALFHLDDYEACLARRGVYCLGSFELDAEPDNQLFRMMQEYSANWADHFNHTRLHRGLCVSARCAPPAPPADDAAWFAACVNATTAAAYNLSARLSVLEYCERGFGGSSAPLTASERGFAALLAALLALAVLSTLLDLTLPDHARNGARWALAWSVRGCWAELCAPPRSAPAPAADLRAFDGLRVLCMMCVIIEHVCWITTHTYLVDTRRFEQTRRAADAMLMANSTLVVQIFFMMSSFLLAHKLLQGRGRGERAPPLATFADTMFTRLVRISPSYFVVLWFAASWWERLGRGPMWAPLVAAEAAVCRRKWWTHLLYLNNVLDADDKCLIQTWYLAADMQLYAAALVLTLALGRLRRGALAILAALALAATAALAALAHRWELLPTFLMHNPESVRSSYRDGPSFNVLYQSPLGNAPGALAGLLLAHAHHALVARARPIQDYKVFRWAATGAVPLAAWWAAGSPRLAPPGGLAVPALAALERPVFAALVALALLGAMHRVPSAVGRVLAWRGWGVWARLSFGALLLHMPINKALVAARLAPSQLDRTSAVAEWFGVAAVSYLAALPLALLVELPAQRLVRALRARAAPPALKTAHKTDL